MSEAEDRLEISALGHLTLRNDLVTVLRAEHVRPKQAPQRMTRW